jgi:HD-GYP domain-containing protein (c-di-GMP phosphodiesterase class II)
MGNIQLEKFLYSKGIKKYGLLYNEINNLLNQMVKTNINYHLFQFNLQKLANNIAEEIDDHEKLFIQIISYLQSNDQFSAHSLNTAIITTIISFLLNIQHNKLLPLIQAAILHDLGKLKYPLEIVKIFFKETEKMENINFYHPIWGKRIICFHLKLSEEIANLVANHHEQYDGSGFPRKFKKNQLNLFDHILITANMMENVIQKINHSGIENLTKTFEYIFLKYPDKFEETVKRALIDLLELKGKAARKFKRYPVDTIATIIDSDDLQKFKCRVNNISCGGMKITTKKKLQTNNIYKIDFALNNYLNFHNKLFQIKWENPIKGEIEYGICFFNPERNLSQACEKYFSELNNIKA